VEGFESWEKQDHCIIVQHGMTSRGTQRFQVYRSSFCSRGKTRTVLILGKKVAINHKMEAFKPFFAIRQQEISGKLLF